MYIVIRRTKDFVEQMEFLLGIKIPEDKWQEIGKAFHLTRGNEGVMKSLEILNKKVSDIIYPEDREVLKKEFGEDSRWEHLFKENAQKNKRRIR